MIENQESIQIPKDWRPYCHDDIHMPILCLFQHQELMTYSKTVTQLFQDQKGLVGLFNRNDGLSKFGNVYYDLLWAMNQPALAITDTGLFLFESANVLSVITKDLGGLVTETGVSPIVEHNGAIEIKKYALLPNASYIPLYNRSQQNTGE